MSSFLNVNTWLWYASNPIDVVAKKYGTDSFMLRFTVEHNSIEVAMSRDILVKMRDQINAILLEETEEVTDVEKEKEDSTLQGSVSDREVAEPETNS